MNFETKKESAKIGTETEGKRKEKIWRVEKASPLLYGLNIGLKFLSGIERDSLNKIITGEEGDEGVSIFF